MIHFNDLAEKKSAFDGALQLFVERVKEDRNVLAVVLVGSISEATIWFREGIHVWIIEADGVTKRLESDGNDERIWRTLCENDINIHAELIARSRFKMMVEGSSRTAFSCNFFAERTLVYCDDPSIEKWFDGANSVAVKDQSKDLMVSLVSLIEIVRHARRHLELKDDLQVTKQILMWAATNVACVEIVRHGEVYEDEVIYRGIELQPELFDEIYIKVLTKKPTKKSMLAVVETLESYIQNHWNSDLAPLLKYLKKQKRTVSLTEICNHFAHGQLYPWTLEAACEWLNEQGHLEKLSVPFKLTKKSRADVEEPAYSF